MSLSELYRPSLKGSLTGTLSGSAVSPVGGLDDPPVSFGEPPQIGPVSPNIGGAVPLGGAFTGAAQAQRGFEDQSAGFLQSAGNVAMAPIHGVLNLLSQLDRPQQFLWASAIKTMETGNALEGLESGFSAAVFRRPEPGGPKRRIEPEELIDSVGKHVFGKESLTSQMHPLAKGALSLGVAIGADPLIFVPGAWYSKAGRRIKNLHHEIVAADASRYAVTGGQDMAVQAARVRDLAVERTLADLGKKGRPLNKVIMNVAQDLTDDELNLVRDAATGMTVSAIDQEIGPILDAAMAAGVDVPASRIAGALQTASDRVSEKGAKSIGDTLNKLIALRRNDVEREALYQFKVGDRTRSVTFEAGFAWPGGTDVMIGQLVNRAGLMPTEAISRAKQAEKFLERNVQRRQITLDQAGIKLKDGGGFEVNALKAWNHMSERSKYDLLNSAPGRNRKVLAKAKFGSESSLAAQLSPIELASLKQAHIGKMLGSVEKELVSRRGFIDKALTPADMTLPVGASRRYEEALRASVGNGRYTIDALVEARLKGVYKAQDLTLQSGKDAAELAAGILRPDSVSDLPNQAVYRESMESLLSSDKRASKDMQVMSFMLEPNVVLPTGIFARMKYGEDLALNMRSAIGTELDKIYNYKGKVVSKEQDDLIGLAGFHEGLDAAAKSGVKFSRLQSELYEASKDAIAKVKADDDLFQIHASRKAYYAGWKESFIRRGMPEMAEGGVMDYMPRLYPQFEKSLQSAVEDGILTAEEAAGMLRRSKGRDFTAMLTPLELDVVNANHVAFQHLKPRGFDVPLPGLQTSATQMDRAYTMGALRKVYLEPMIQDVNQMSRTLPKWRKEYARLLLRRMMGMEILDEEAVNNLVSTANGMFGQIAQKASGGLVKADAPIFTTPRPATKLALSTTRMFYRGLLGGNVGFFLKNLSQGINTATHEGPFNFMRGISMMVTNPKLADGKGFRELAANRHLLNETKQFLQEGTYTGLEGVKKTFVAKMDHILFAPAKFSEFLNRGIGMAAGMQREMKAAGFTSMKEFAEKSPQGFTDAVNYGHAVANETQFLYGIMGRSPLAGSPIGRLGLQFYSFPIKQAQFLARGWKDEGSMFMLRYLTLSGMFSHMAEWAGVDAEGFSGLGFAKVSDEGSPTMQALKHLNAAVYSSTVEDNEEATRENFKRFTKSMEGLIPGILQIQKSTRALESIETGEQRGYRDRLSRQTSDPNRTQRLSGILDATVNPINEIMGLPRLSGEQAVGLTGLPSTHQKKYRETIQAAEQARQDIDKKYRRYTDDYIKAYYTGNFVRAQEIQKNAERDGVYLDQSTIRREVMSKSVPTFERFLKTVRGAERLEAAANLYDEDPSLHRHVPGVVPLPPDALGGTK